MDSTPELRKILEDRPPLDFDPHPHVFGVLLSDEIEYYATKHRMIDPFDVHKLKPAAYELTVGDEYFLSGQYFSLTPGDNAKTKIVIPPFEVAVIKTAEILCLPRFIIARWNIRVSHAYAGLLWVGAPQVDPGWVGHLFCPIYNLSDRAAVLSLGESLAVMDFVKTTPFRPEETANPPKRYDFPPKRLVISDYNLSNFRSALFTRAGQQLTEIEAQLGAVQRRVDMFATLAFTILSLILAIVMGAASRGLSINVGDAGIATISIWASMVAILTSFLAYGERWITRSIYERYGQLIGLKLNELMGIFRIRRIIILAMGVGLISILSVQIFSGIHKVDSGAVTHAELLKAEAALRVDIARATASKATNSVAQGTTNATTGP
jgi:deoxycytidine triphosphate deaminase